MMRSGRKNEAIAHLWSALKLRPQDGMAYQWLGSLVAESWEGTLETRKTDFGRKGPLQQLKVRHACLRG